MAKTKVSLRKMGLWVLVAVIFVGIVGVSFQYLRGDYDYSKAQGSLWSDYIEDYAERHLNKYYKHLEEELGDDLWEDFEAEFKKIVTDVVENANYKDGLSQEYKDLRNGIDDLVDKYRELVEEAVMEVVGFVKKDVSEVEAEIQQTIDQVRWDAYRGFFAYLALGTIIEEGQLPEIRPLPIKIKTQLNKHYFPEYTSLRLRHEKNIFNSPINKVAVAYTKNIPDDVAITDCNKIYWGDSNGSAKDGGYAMYKAVVDGKDIKVLTDKQLRWLLHEMQHVRQCYEEGSREEYADMWFTELWDTLGVMLAGGDYADLEVWKIHDAMPLEKDADDVADCVYKVVKGELANVKECKK